MRTPVNIYVAVVDDDDSICRSFSRLFRAAGFHAITYPSAEAFLEDKNHPRFDCLVLDIQLEGMSGIELSRRLAAVNDITPVLFITAHEDPNTNAEALSTGCAGFFRKTDPGAALVGAIRRLVGPRAGDPLPPPGLSTLLL